MSEAELHIIRAVCAAGHDKARRGELEIRPPVGLVYRSDGKIILDPNSEVQSAIRMLFETFARTASAKENGRFFRDQGLLFPTRLQSGPNKGELTSGAAGNGPRVLQYCIIHAMPAPLSLAAACALVAERMGAPTSLRCPERSGSLSSRARHPGYIDRDCFEANQRRLIENGRAFRADRRAAARRVRAPRCCRDVCCAGICGERMGVRYFIR